MAADPEDLRAGDWFLFFENGHTDRAAGVVESRAKLGRYCMVRARGDDGAPQYAMPVGYLMGQMLWSPGSANAGTASLEGEVPPVTLVPTAFGVPPRDGSVIHFFGNV